jgi:hypothetical protein
MRWAGHIAHMGDMRNVYTTLIGKPKWKNHLEDLDVDGKVILKLILEK